MINDFTVQLGTDSYPCFHVTSKEKAEEVISKLLAKDTILAADLETAASPEWKHIGDAALYPQLAKPRLLQMFTGTGAVVIDLFQTGPIDLKRLFEGRPSVFHNMTFDYKMLRHHYNVVDVDMHCTCIMARIVFHALFAEDKKADLRNVMITLFGEELNKKAGRSDWSIPNLTFEQIRYAALDAIAQMKMYEKLSEYIDKLGLRKVYDLYRKAQIVICEMELNGINFDKKAHIENVYKWREALLDARDDVLATTGLTKITDTELAKWLERTLPPETLAIWPRTEPTEKGGGGKIKTDSNTFVEFSYLDIVKPFSRYQKLKKLTTSFGTNLIEMLNPATGKLHPGYRVAGAKTGRLSCSEPNIQQMPKAPSKEDQDKGVPDIRRSFVPSPGYVLVVADYSQVEVRCIAEHSNDPMMLAAYEDGLDMYSYTAAHLAGKPIEHVTKQERQAAKALVLGLNYGLGSKKFTHYAKKGYGVDISEEEADKQVKAYRKLYSGLRKWQMQQVDLCAARRYTAFSSMGKSRKLQEDNYFCASINHPIQSDCSSIMLLALVKAKEGLIGTSAKLLASVHDEIVLECLPEEVEKVEEIVKAAMIAAYLEVLPSKRTIKNLVEPSHGLNWSEAK